MRHLTKTNKHFLLVGLTFLATSLIFYIFGLVRSTKFGEYSRKCF